MYENMYYNVDHLLNLLDVKFVPTIVLLSPEGSVINVLTGGMTPTQMQNVINSYK